MRFVAQIKLLMAILPIVLALGACGSSSSSSDSDDQNTALCDSIIALTMGAPRVNISISLSILSCSRPRVFSRQTDVIAAI